MTDQWQQRADPNYDTTADASNIDGNAAHDAADVGDPIKTGGRASATEPSAVDEGDRVNRWHDLTGHAAVRSKSYSASDTADRNVPTQDMSDRFSTQQELVDATDVAAATNYYPSATGIEMGQRDSLAIQMVCSGGVTATVEATLDDAGSPDWVDITESFYSSNTHAKGNASYVDQTDIIQRAGLTGFSVRVKSVTADATNGVQYHYATATRAADPGSA